MKNISLVLVFTILTLYGVDDNILNEDGTSFEAPRLAGDSLPIKPYVKKPKVSEVENIVDAFTHATVKGLLRYSAQRRNTDLSIIHYDTGYVPEKKLQQYSTAGGFLGIETAPLFYTSVGATFYTSQPVGSYSNVGLGGVKEVVNEDGVREAESYTVLGEAFIKVEKGDNRLTYGRQEMPNYRFISLSNIRMTPFTHQGATYENRSFENLQLNFALISKQKNRNAEEFKDMVYSARVKTGCELDSTGKCLDSTKKQFTRGDINLDNFDETGAYVGENKSMFMLGSVYKGEDFSVEAWDYYVDDFVNTLYLYGDYSFILDSQSSITVAGQFASQKDVGEGVAGDVSTWFYGIKAQYAHTYGVTLFTAFNEIAYNEDSYDGGTVFIRWGTPQMFNSYQVQDSEYAGTKSAGVGVQFELGKMQIIPNTVVRFRHAYYNMPDAIYQVDARQDRSETTFDLRYSFRKNDGFGIYTTLDGLSLQLRVAYDNFRTDYDFEAYQLEHGYSFESVTENFIDTRFYLDYIF